jgi:hypothetical protein
LERFDLHTTLSEHHRQIMDSFAGRPQYRNRRAVLERALELLSAIDDEDVEQMLYVHKFRNSVMRLFNYVMLSGDDVDSIMNAVLKTETTDRMLNSLVDSVAGKTKTVQKVLGRTAVNNFSDMVRAVRAFHDYLNILGEISVDEERRQLSAKMNVLRSIPELWLEILDEVLEASSYTFDIRIENEGYPVVVVHWIPPEDYPPVKKLKEERLRVGRQKLIAALSGRK